MEELPVSRQNFSLLGLLVPGTNRGPVGDIRRRLAGGLEILAVVLGALLGYRPNAQDFAFSSFSGQVNDATGAAITNAEVKLASSRAEFR
jgi:hypothetical protein